MFLDAYNFWTNQTQTDYSDSFYGKTRTSKSWIIHDFEYLIQTGKEYELVFSGSTKGAFTNYVDNILPTIDHLPLRQSFFTGIGKNWHTINIYSTPYLPRLVNVVCERPLKNMNGISQGQFIRFMLHKIETFL